MKGSLRQKRGRRHVSISLDLDNLWSYMKTHGSAGWESFPTYLDELVDIVLDRLARHRLRITFFVVGQDAALATNARALRAIAEAGHEIANHSFHHEPWLHLRTRQQIDQEIALAEKAIEDATGQRPVGFRGPGFSCSSDTISVLAERGYLYDASTFPTFLGPLARRYYFSTTESLSSEAKRQRARMFGTLADGFRPLRPYFWRTGGNPLVEIPVTTVPLVRVPMHQSYLVHLAGRSAALARRYLGTALSVCRLCGIQPSFLLHPTDFLGADRVRGLEFFPGMQLNTARKLELFDEVITVLKRAFVPVGMKEHALLAIRELHVAGSSAGRVYA
jgi:hypothetical protein